MERIEFVGVEASRLDPLPAQLAQQPGKPLRAVSVRQSLRRLYATGLYDSISAQGRLEGDEVVLTFGGEPRTFIGVVTVTGAKGANMNALLVRSSRLAPGTRFTSTSITQAETEMRKALAQNGFHEPSFSHKLTPHPKDQLVDIAYEVASGTQARTGSVGVAGNSGMTPDEFRRYSKLKPGRKVDRETTGNALAGIEKRYRKQQRLEAEVKLESQDFVPAKKVVDYQFSANQGPLVHVLVDGVSLSKGKIRKLLPIYEEGSVDEDLLNEGNRQLQNYYQRLGYFDVKVQHEQRTPNAGIVEIVFRVKLGAKHRVEKVTITGAKYFNLPTLQERLSVSPHDAFDRAGIYNQSLAAADVGSLQAVYQNNGFPNVKVTPEIQDADNQGQTPINAKVVPLKVVYHIDEGQQTRIHSVQLQGTEKIASAQLAAMLNTAVGQPLSAQNLAGDRDTLITYYLSRGFDQARVEVVQTEQPNDPSQADVVFRIYEGEQVFLRRVLITGLHYTRPDTIARRVTMKEGQPLDQSALLDTQRNLYDLTLFNEVNPVIQNPAGEEPRKTVLLQITEARRWDLSYGAGFEVQTGTVSGGAHIKSQRQNGSQPARTV